MNPSDTPDYDPYAPVQRPDGGYLMHGKIKKLQPIHNQLGKPKDAPEVDMIRNKLLKLYAAETGVQTIAPKKTAVQASSAQPESKHQKVMYQLNHSGKSMAEIQVEWHNYYQALSDKEKNEVWKEFYASNANQKPAPEAQAEKLVELRNQVTSGKDRRSKAVKVLQESQNLPKSKIDEQIQTYTKKAKKITKNQQFQSIIFGLSMGTLATIILLFSFFNERIIAPFIQPSRKITNTPLIVGTEDVAATSTPQVIIPKINLEIPVIYQPDSSEAAIETFLDQGAVHYPTTSSPGQNGNTAIYGHSSNNIFNKGQYKFAFVLLHMLQPGDTFYLTKYGKVYVYKVFSKRVVDPSEVGVLLPIEGHQATATLITCDPPGTSLRRLIIVGDQVSPSLDGNAAAAPVAASTGTTDSQAPPQLASNSKTLWYRFTHSDAWIISAIIVSLATTVVVRRKIKRRSAKLGF